MPRWTYPSRADAPVTNSPSTLNSKWPGSFRAGCWGPTGTMNLSPFRPISGSSPPVTFWAAA